MLSCLFVCRRVLCIRCTVTTQTYSCDIPTHKTTSPPEQPFSHCIHSCHLAAEMWTTMKNNLLGKTSLSCYFYTYRFRKYASYGFPIINFFNPVVHYETPCISIFYQCAFVGLPHKYKYSLEQLCQPITCYLNCDTQQILITIMFSTSQLERLLSKWFIIFWPTVPCSSYIAVSHSCLHFHCKDVMLEVTPTSRSVLAPFRSVLWALDPCTKGACLGSTLLCAFSGIIVNCKCPWWWQLCLFIFSVTCRCYSTNLMDLIPAGAANP